MVNIFLGLYAAYPSSNCFRGDTISDSCKKAGHKFKLDLRLVMIQNDENIVDSCTGEMAKKATEKKIYKDKLKSVIASKSHLNTFIKEVPYIRAQDVLLIKISIIQVMASALF
ncbi:unnamed protein product [Mucor hiemalis]